MSDLIKRIDNAIANMAINSDLLRDCKAEIERVYKCLIDVNKQAEHFEREWYLRGDEIERLSALAETPEAVTRIQELEQLVKAQQKAFDIESNRITFAEHKSFHKMLIRDAIKKMNDCKGRPYSAWDTWLIDATCMLERVLREWPAPREVTLMPQSYTPSVDALIADLNAATRWDYIYNRGEIEWESSPIGDWIKETDILNIINKYRAQS